LCKALAATGADFMFLSSGAEHTSYATETTIFIHVPTRDSLFSKPGTILTRKLEKVLYTFKT